MSKITLQGTIVTALQPEQGISQRTGNPWQKQTFIIETSTNPQFSTRVAVTSFKSDLIDKFLGFPPGSAVEVDCWVESRESNSGRWFTEVTAADIRPRMQYTPQQPQQPVPVQYQPQGMQPQYQPSGKQFSAPQPQPAPAPHPQTNDQRFAQQYQQGLQQQYQPQQQQPEQQEFYQLPF